RPNVRQVRWVLNDEMAHGINLFEIMFYMSTASKYGGPHGFMASDSFPGVMKYANRASYLLAQGRPATNIALLFPTSSLWLRDTTANASTWHMAEQLIEHQRNFDFVDDQMLPDMLSPDGNVLKNKSGQEYKTVIIPAVNVLPQMDIRVLNTFAKAGGHVIFTGQKPPMVENRTFRNADNRSDLKWAIHDPSGQLTANVLGALPDPDVKLNKTDAAIEYTHRHLKNGEIYFFFNRSDKKQEQTVTVKGSGQVQVWEANTGRIIHIQNARIEKRFVKLSLTLKPYESRFIVVGPLPDSVK
ncbi:MAG TPA: glycosyl hydrolase, partial [Balneolales bacterium]|nr:glycosyl hydrolase [Balneolales bacterium]